MTHKRLQRPKFFDNLHSAQYLALIGDADLFRMQERASAYFQRLEVRLYETHGRAHKRYQQRVREAEVSLGAIMKERLRRHRIRLVTEKLIAANESDDFNLEDIPF